MDPGNKHRGDSLIWGRIRWVTGTRNVADRVPNCSDPVISPPIEAIASVCSVLNWTAVGHCRGRIGVALKLVCCFRQRIRRRLNPSLFARPWFASAGGVQPTSQELLPLLHTFCAADADGRVKHWSGNRVWPGTMAQRISPNRVLPVATPPDCSARRDGSSRCGKSPAAKARSWLRRWPTPCAA